MQPPYTGRPGRARPSAVLLACVALACSALAGCSGDPGAETSSAPSGSPATGGPSGPSGSSAPARPALPAVAGTVATGLEVPWGVAFLPDGSALVAERKTGDVYRVREGERPALVGRVPGVADLGEGGLLGIALAPGDEKTLFAYLTTERDNRVVAIPLGTRTASAGPTLVTSQVRVLLSGIANARNHNGGRIVVGPDGKLWIGTGDAGDTSLSQRRDSLSGKILRLDLDGSVPADNPFPGSPVWSLGHRNVQGLAFDSRGGLWATEFGQNTFDELNRIEAGKNYGWPDVEGTGGTGRGFVDPQVTWRTSEASPSGLAIVDDVAYVAALRGRRLWVVPLSAVPGRAGTPVAALTGELGRLRTVEPAPGGGLLVTTSNRDGRGDPRPGDDRVVRLALPTSR